MNRPPVEEVVGLDGEVDSDEAPVESALQTLARFSLSSSLSSLRHV